MLSSSLIFMIIISCLIAISYQQTYSVQLETRNETGHIRVNVERHLEGHRMTIFEFAVVLITAPAIATLCYGAYLSYTGKDQASVPRASSPTNRESKPATQSAQALPAT